MPIFDAGLFLILGGGGFVSLLLSFKIGALLKALAAFLFFGLAIVMFGQYDVAYVENFYGTSECTETDPCVTEKYLIRENHNWLAWVFVAFGIFSALLFFLEMIGFFETNQEGDF